MPKGRLVFDGDNIYTEKDARIYKLKSSVSSKIDAIPGVVDSLDSTSATDALSANMGRQLQDQINSLSGTGKFLSTWDCTTGLPGTNPQEDPYTYKAGDYYVVSATGSTNYKPHGGTYTQGVPSTTVELENVGVNDKYYFDGADWVRIPDTAIQIGIDSALSTTSTNAVENRAIANAINTKQNIISDLNTIRSGAAAGATALQALDNITELTNNAGYQTAGDVAVAIQSAIGQLPTVNDGVLTIQKNSTTIDTFSANSANNKTINIPVPTTVAELSDANNYATKTDLNNAIDSLIHEGSTAPQNPQEGDMWYDTVNHVLKIYNGTTWETVDTDTDTRYTAGNGINISAQNVISADTSVVATQSDLNSKQDTLTAGTNIQISNNVISATSTTYTAGEGIEIKNGVDYSAMQGPCPNGFHVPLYSELNGLKETLSTTFGISLSGSSMGDYLKMPFAGLRGGDDGVISGVGTEGNYWTCSHNSEFSSYLFFLLKINSAEARFYSGGPNSGYSIRPFKDEPVIPDSAWTTLYDGSSVANGAGIFRNPSLGLISVSGDGTNWVTITDKNLGATTVYNSGDALTANNCGGYFQWGNCYMFSFDGTEPTSRTTVDITGYGPGNYYYGDTFIVYYIWFTANSQAARTRAYNLRGGETGVVTITNAITSTQLSDAAFSPSWDGDTTHAPSKNAIYDVLGNVETLLANL